ncbi:tannase/feruloyl esterase family alpha/beta hydrolase [Aquincola sp. MAHUQ-54]|uniref:Tannase/feruloyl esterase family alpha/beta hydrolase n=1 Tax=Aquincola agrisoli TaxID=3119538 RepID=A0AAW9QFY7_9BURK
MRNPFPARRAQWLAGACAVGIGLLVSGCGDDDDDDGTPPVSAQAACDALAGQTVAGATIRTAVIVPAAQSVGEYCRVLGSIRTSLNFEVRLPTTWNKKLLYGGGGGWDGAISGPPQSPSATTAGYVIVSSDGGRQGSNLDASSFLRNPQGQQDFGYLSIHTVLEAAKAIVHRRYDAAPERSYFEGCSNGGREALIQATRFPNDYDGIVVRAPAYSFTELFQAFVANGKALNAPGGQINDAKAALIGNAVRAQCDAADGVADGIVSHQEACSFDPAALRCTAGDADTCLTDAQIHTVNTIYGELRRADSSLVYPGWGPGGEGLGWPAWVTGTAVGGTGLQFQFGSGLIKYWVTQDPAFDVLTFNPENYAPALGLAASTLDAGPDLRTFFARGGKMVLVHGTHDWAISYKGSIKYFNDVAATVGGASVRDASMEFFLQPGVQHCSGGVGPDTVELVDAVAKWAESNTRPSAQGIVARKLDTAGAIQASRPLCRYPTFPKYKGSGDVNAAESYTCQAS